MGRCRGWRAGEVSKLVSGERVEGGVLGRCSVRSERDVERQIGWGRVEVCVRETCRGW